MSISYFAARRQLLEGPGDAHSGAWQISWFRIAKGWGMPPEAFWPGQGIYVGSVVPNEPPNIDAIAKLHRLSHYQRLRTPLECLYAIAVDQPFTATFEIGKEWATAPKGHIPPVLASAGEIVHSVGFQHFDFEIEKFVFGNSWGGEWGDNGLGYLSIEHLNRYMIEAWIMGFGIPHRPEKPGCRLRFHEERHTRLGVSLVVDVYDDDNDIVVGWMHAVLRKKTLEVEELFVRPDYRGRGYGSLLVSKISEQQKKHLLKVVFWIPWGDHIDQNQVSLIKWAQKCGLRIEPSEVRFAAFKATPGTPVDSLPELAWIPKKATGPLSALLDEEEAVEAKPAPQWTEEMADRRAELVEKKYRSALSAEEQAELSDLQEEFGKYQDFISPLSDH